MFKAINRIISSYSLKFKYVLLYLFIFSYLIAGFNIGFDNFNEAIPLVCAERISAGEIPYKDFSTISPPGQFYLLYFVMSIFGWQIIIARLFNILIIFISLFILHKISNSFRNQLSSSFLLFIGVVWIAFIPYLTSPIPIITLIIFTTILSHLNFIEYHKYKYIIINGCSTALIFYFNLYFGIYILTVCFVSIIIQSLIPSFASDKKFTNKITPILLYTVSFLAIVIPAAIYLILNADLNQIVQQIFYLPQSIHDYFRYNLPRELTLDLSESLAPTIRQLWGFSMYFLPVAINLIAVYLACFKFKALVNTERIKLTYLITLNILLSAHSFIFISYENLLPAMMITLILISFIIYRISSFQLKQLAYTVCFFILISIPLANKVELLNQAVSQNKIRINIPRANLIKTDSLWAEDYQPAINFLIENVPDKERIFSGDTRHDKNIINDVMVYFLAQRLPATKYVSLPTGLASSDTLQKEIISELEKNRVHFIFLYDNSFVNTLHSNITKSGIYRLDEYIRDNFVIEKKFGAYSILKRRSYDF